MENWLEKAQPLLTEYGPKVIAALAILVLGYLIAKMITGVARKAMKKAGLDATLVSFLSNLAYMLLMVLVIIAVLTKLGVDTTSFAAVLAAAGLAIGLALQGSLGNFASGVMIIALRPFKVGDLVEVAGAEGVVDDISVFATRLVTKDNRVLLVPNGSITDGTITNYTAEEIRRVDMVFGIGYGDDIKKAKDVFWRVLKDNPKVLDSPTADVAVSELADSSVNFVVRPWCKTDDYFDVMFEVTEGIKLACDAEGISIPFPQQDVHMHQVA
ncbi:MAG: mechanosensitive ion channel [Deltaproteobacteria bacterium]|nr:mechanosensitive ion channel [Deltaproteobacteria bacterium]